MTDWEKAKGILQIPDNAFRGPESNDLWLDAADRVAQALAAERASLPEPPENYLNLEADIHVIHPGQSGENRAVDLVREIRHHSFKAGYTKALEDLRKWKAGG